MYMAGFGNGPPNTQESVVRKQRGWVVAVAHEAAVRLKKLVFLCVLR